MTGPYAALLGVRQYVVAVVVVGVVVAMILHNETFPTWLGWQAAVGGSVQVIGPLVTAYSCRLGQKLWTGNLGEIHQVSPTSAGLILGRAALAAWTLTVAAYAVVVVAVGAATSGAWQPTVTWSLLTPVVAFPIYVAVGLAVGYRLHSRAVPIVLLPLVYLAACMSLAFDDTTWSRLGVVRQPVVDLWAVEHPSSFAVYLGFLAALSAAAVAVLVAAHATRGRTLPILSVVAVVALCAGAGPAAAFLVENPTTTRDRSVTLACLPVDTGPAFVPVCLHPAAESTRATVAATITHAHPRVARLIPATGYDQAPGAYRDLSDEGHLRFDVFDPAPDAVQLGLREAIAAYVFTRCDLGRLHGPELEVLDAQIGWVAGGPWPDAEALGLRGRAAGELVTATTSRSRIELVSKALRSCGWAP